MHLVAARVADMTRCCFVQVDGVVEVLEIQLDEDLNYKLHWHLVTVWAGPHHRICGVPVVNICASRKLSRPKQMPIRRRYTGLMLD